MTALENLTHEQLEVLRANLTRGCLAGLAHHEAGTLDVAQSKKGASPREALALSYSLLLQVEAAMGLTAEA